MQDPSRHARKRNAIEDVLRHLPGFQGYLEKEYRRESDELTRQRLADQLSRSKQALEGLSRRLADKAQLDDLPRIDRLRGVLDRLIARIRGAMQGYSGFFDLVQIDEDALDRIYLFDLDLISQGEAIVQAVEQLPTGQGDLADTLTEVRSRLEQFDRLWDQRDDMLRGLD
jgi:hypothetical protein